MLIEAALGQMKTLNLTEISNLPVYKALDAFRIVDQATRQRLIPEIKEGLRHRLEPATVTVEAMEAPALPETKDEA